MHKNILHKNLQKTLKAGNQLARPLSNGLQRLGALLPDSRFVILNCGYNLPQPAFPILSVRLL